MTVRQEAYQLIDTLPDESVRILVELMGKMQKDTAPTGNAQRREDAFALFESMRRPVQGFDYRKELDSHREVKYGADRPD